MVRELRCVLTRAQQRLRGLEIVARHELLAVAHEDRLLVELHERVALPAHLRRARRRQPRRVDDRRIGATAEVQPVATQRVVVGRDVRLAGAVARLAGDAHLADARVGGAPVGGDARLPARRVARDAARVPLLLGLMLVGRMEEDGAARDPALLVEQVGERHRQLAIAGAGRDPIDLHVVRARDHRDAALDARRRPGELAALIDDELRHRIDHLGEEVVATAEEAHVVQIVDEPLVGEVALDRRGRGVRGHRAVEAVVPRVVLRRVTRFAALGGGVAVARLLRDRRRALLVGLRALAQAGRRDGEQRQRRDERERDERAARSGGGHARVYTVLR